jgi:O-antigen ligase
MLEPANRTSDNRLLVVLAVISLTMALGVLEFKGLGILEFKAVPILALCALPWLIVFCCARPMRIVLLWIAISFYEEVVHSAFSSFPTLGQLGVVLLLPMDIPYFFTLTYLLIVAVTRPHEIRKILKDYPFLVVFILMMIASIVIYTPEYGKTAIGEARKSFFCFFFPVLAVTAIKTFTNLHRLLLGVLLLAAGVSALGYLLLFIGPSIIRSSLRPISANGALILLFTIFSILIAHANKLVIASKTIDNVMVGLFIPLVIIPHHRTVFLAGILGLFLLFELHQRKVFFVLKAATTSVILLAGICIAFTSVPKFERTLMKALAGIANPSADHTASWRMEGWRQQLVPLSESELLFGKGLGSYYSWDYQNQEVTVGPHNAYVEIVLKFGVLGLAVYALLALSFLRRMFAARKKLPPGPARAYIEMGIANFGAAHAIMTGYDLSLIALIFYAIGITAVRLLQDGWDVTAWQEEMSREKLIAISRHSRPSSIRGRPGRPRAITNALLCVENEQGSERVVDPE